MDRRNDGDDKRTNGRPFGRLLRWTGFRRKRKTISECRPLHWLYGTVFSTQTHPHIESLTIPCYGAIGEKTVVRLTSRWTNSVTMTSFAYGSISFDSAAGPCKFNVFRTICSKPYNTNILTIMYYGRILNFRIGRSRNGRHDITTVMTTKSS